MKSDLQMLLLKITFVCRHKRTKSTFHACYLEPAQTRGPVFLSGTHVIFMETFTHRSLCEDLAKDKPMAITEVPLGAMWKNRNQTPRADVVQINPTYDSFAITIYEVKRTRTDLLKDLREEKWKKYLPHSNCIYFACLQGLCKRNEIPNGIGLCCRSEKGWYTLTVPEFRHPEIPVETLKAIMFQRVKDELHKQRRKRMAYDHRVSRRLKKLGDEIAKALPFYRQYRGVIKRLIETGQVDEPFL